jgi:predicted nucleic acid-binding protein
MSVLRFLDTNILLYSISTDPSETPKRATAIALLEADDVALSVQCYKNCTCRRPAPRDRMPWPTTSRSG